MELTLIAEAAVENWAKIDPAIFGTLFVGSMDQKERHALGAHFTSEADIQKVIQPTIIRPWRERISATRESTLLARESLEAGQQKLRAGSTTTYEVLQLQRDLRSAELAEARARTDYNEAIAELDRQSGTTPERNGISLSR